MTRSRRAVRAVRPVGAALAVALVLAGCSGGGVEVRAPDVDVTPGDLDVQAPSVDVPDVDLPSVDVPSVDVPDVDASDLPDVDVSVGVDQGGDGQ
ncbi:MAG: hypothetical protein M3P93_03560 [Actinomycetota bacterium]|nr:hypothetical protein [Actinomycetota bacterium]